MNVRNLVCIVCPRGCALTVTLSEDGTPSRIEGNGCARGATYAEKECTHPERTVTTTVRCADGAIVPVKTATTVPKDAVFAVMKHINETTPPVGVKIGDVILENVAETGVAVVATGSHPCAEN